jgi:hypothetical protein
MSSHNEEHHTESKPVSFTVPFLMASALLLIIVLFLSLCDPSKEHHEKHSEAAVEPETEKVLESKVEKNTEVAVDSTKSALPAADKVEEVKH